MPESRKSKPAGDSPHFLTSEALSLLPDSSKSQSFETEAIGSKGHDQDMEAWLRDWQVKWEELENKALERESRWK